MNAEQKLMHDKAWELLGSTSLKLGEKMLIRSHFTSLRKDEYPFITSRYIEGDVSIYHSEIEAIKSFSFKQEKEVILANAIYEQVKDSFDPNDFIQMLKFTFRILGVENEWTR